MLGRSKCRLTARAGNTVETVVYVVRGAKESLLGLKDGEELGIIKIQPEGGLFNFTESTVRQVDDDIAEGGQCSGGQTQEQIDQDMVDLVEKFPKVFKGLGRATGVTDIHIEMDESVPPVQQKQRQVPLMYKQKLKDHLEELVKEGVVTPLECTNGTGWIHNVCASHESLSNAIRLGVLWCACSCFKSPFLGKFPPICRVIAWSIIMSDGLWDTMHHKGVLQLPLQLLKLCAGHHGHLWPATVIINQNMEIIFSCNWPFVVS